MFKKISAAALVAVGAMSVATLAHATDIPAAPMNSGPLVMTGMGPVGALFNVGITPVNMVVQPISAMGTPAAAPMAAPMMMKKHHHHHMMKHMMMKKKMM